MAAPLPGGATGGGRPGLLATAARLYRHDAVWRGAVDVAAIGAVVMALAAPALNLPFPRLGGGAPSASYQAAAGGGFTARQPSATLPPGPVDAEVERLHKAARAGDAIAQFGLAEALRWGRGVGQDKDEAEAWYRRSAEQGNPDAMAALAQVHRVGDGVPVDYAEAGRWYRAAADRGDRRGHAGLADLLAEGKGMATDYAEAARHYHQAAKAGDPAAQLALGRMLLEGVGVAADPFTAAFWLELARVGGQASAAGLAEKVVLDKAERETALTAARAWAPGGDAPRRPSAEEARRGRVVVADLAYSLRRHAEAARLVEPAAKAGDAAALYMLGRMQRSGRGVVKDLAASEDSIRRAAEKGDPRAMVWRASTLSESAATAAAARDMLERAAATGDVYARSWYGIFLARSDDGPPRDAAQAVNVLAELEDVADAEALQSLGALVRAGLGTAKDSRRASRLQYVAADLGDRDAQYAMARAYRDGDGVPHDPRWSAFFLTLAAAADHMMAKEELAALRKADRALADQVQGAAGTWRPGLLTRAKATRPPDAKERAALDAAADLARQGDAASARAAYGRLADSGLPEAENAIGVLHELGLGGPKDATQALRWYRAAAGHGDPLGVANLARFYLTGTAVGRDIEIARDLLRVAAREGVGDAMVELARLHDTAGYRLHSPLAAQVWAARAADLGNADGEAMARALAPTLAPADLELAEQARVWLIWESLSEEERPRDGARLPEDAEQRLDTAGAHWAKGDYAPVLEIVRSLAAAGESRSQNTLAEMYYRGTGVDRDLGKAAFWARRADAQGHPNATALLGLMHEAGRGAPANLAEAARLYRNAADSVPWAARRLGMLYEGGRGVVADPGQAVRWYRVAAEGGEPAAAAALGRMLQAGQGTARDYAEAARWYRVAADGGEVAGMVGLGMLHRTGLGVTKDSAIAAVWLAEAARRGHAGAQEAYGRILRDGDGVAADPVEAYAWLALAEKGGVATAAKDRAELDAVLTGVQRELAGRRAAELEAAP